MLSNNVYVNYITLNSHDEVYAFINEGTPLVSNEKDWRLYIDRLVSYKDQHLKDYQQKADGSCYRNVYAHAIKTLIPYEVPKEKWGEWIEMFIHTIDARFKKLLWIYKLSTINEANYVEIVLFSRYVYKKPKRVNDTYNQDYYYNSITGKRCSKDNENAVLKAKKDSVKTKEDGSAITKTVAVKEVEERVFKFKNFKRFVQKLKNKYMKVLNTMINHVVIYKIVSRITLDDDDSKCVRKAKFLKNRKIAEINDILKTFQDSIDNGKIYSSIDDIYKKLNKMIGEVDSMIHKEHEEIEKIKSFIKTWWIQKVTDQL